MGGLLSTGLEERSCNALDKRRTHFANLYLDKGSPEQTANVYNTAHIINTSASLFDSALLKGHKRQKPKRNRTQ